MHEKTDSDGDSNGDDKENEPKPSELPQQTKDNLGNVEENKDKSKNIKRKGDTYVFLLLSYYFVRSAVCI